MKSKLFLFLSLILLSVNVHAAPKKEVNNDLSSSSSSSSSSCGADGVGVDALNLAQFFAPFENYNDHLRVDKILKEHLEEHIPVDNSPGAPVDPIRLSLLTRALEDVRESHRLLSVYPYSKSMILDALEPPLGHLASVKTLKKIAADVEKKANDVSIGSIEDKKLAAVLYQYNDHWKLDDLVASILSQGTDADPDMFNVQMRNAHDQMGQAATLTAQQDDADEILKKLLGPIYFKTYNIRESLNFARFMATKNIEETLIMLLEHVPHVTTERKEAMRPSDIRKAMELAKQAVNLDVAVMCGRKDIVRHQLATWKGGYPIKVFRDIVLHAVEGKDEEMLKFLLSRMDVYKLVLSKAVLLALANPSYKGIDMVSFLLKIQHADHAETIRQEYERVVKADYFPLQKVFEDSGRLTPAPFNPFLIPSRALNLFNWKVKN